MEELLVGSDEARTGVKASNAEYVKTIDELNKANINQGGELQRQAEKLTEFVKAVINFSLAVFK